MKIIPQTLLVEKSDRIIKAKKFKIQKPALVSKEKSPYLKKCLEKINGLEWLKKGDTILIKANINSDHLFPGTTNPLILKKLIELLYSEGAGKVTVGDRSSIFWEGTKTNAERTGIKQATESAGAEFIAFEDYKWIKAGDFWITEKINDFNKIINLCVLKTHSLADFTLSLKNMMGITHPRTRTNMHLHNREKKIAMIHKYVTPDMNIVDGTKCFIDGGPATGELREPNVLFASRDRIALDVTCVNFLKSLGSKRLKDLNAWNHDQIRTAVKLGIGIKSDKDIKLV